MNFWLEQGFLEFLELELEFWLELWFLVGSTEYNLENGNFRFRHKKSPNVPFGLERGSLVGTRIFMGFSRGQFWKWKFSVHVAKSHQKRSGMTQGFRLEIFDSKLFGREQGFLDGTMVSLIFDHSSKVGSFRKMSKLENVAIRARASGGTMGFIRGQSWKVGILVHVAKSHQNRKIEPFGLDLGLLEALEVSSEKWDFPFTSQKVT